MANYKEESVTGNKWRRCRTIHIDNNFGTTPRIVFMEQDVVNLGGEYVFKDVHPVHPTGANATLIVNFDPTTSIPIYDPVTLEPTGETTTHMDVYKLLFSAYLHAAKERDLASEQQQP